MPRVLPDHQEEQARRAWGALMQRSLERAGRTRQGLAEECRISRAQLDKYLNGEVSPPGKHLAALGAAAGVDVLDQLAALNWLDERDAVRYQRERVRDQQLNVHVELQRLVQLDEEVNEVLPVARLVSPLMREGWTAEQWCDVRGDRRPVPFVDLVALTPPSGDHQLHETLSGSRGVDLEGLALVDVDARRGLTEGEVEVRRRVELLLGPGRFHSEDPYWHEKIRHVRRFRGYPMVDYAGLVLAVPRLLARKFPDDDASALRNLRSGRRLNSICFLGLPYCGAPDLAAVLSREVLRWGYAGAGMLTRERWRVWPEQDNELRLETSIAEHLARGVDPRLRNTAWHFNFPQAIPASSPLLAESGSSAAVVHLRFTDDSLSSFLLPYWGGIPGRTLEDLKDWRDRCDAVREDYISQFGEEDWVTIDVQLDAGHIGIDEEPEDRRMDYYLGELRLAVEAWLYDTYGVSRPRFEGVAGHVLSVVGEEPSLRAAVKGVARNAEVTNRHAEILLENVQGAVREKSDLEFILYARRNKE